MSSNVESVVRERYAQGATQQVPELCCAVSYDPGLLEAIPAEVIERDYGCGDPSKFLRTGETVLDLGSGGGKACFIAAQVVGAEGSVIGVDMTPEMLDLARRNAPLVADNLGYANVTFHRGRIQDLATDLDHPDAEDPMVATDSVDTVISNCVLNLVEPDAKPAMFQEIARVLKHGGRAVISDVVSDSEVPQRLRDDPNLWTGCISGALTEEAFAQGFLDAGLGGLQLLERDEEPWQVVEGIAFRSITVAAYKGLAMAPIDSTASCGPGCC